MLICNGIILIMQDSKLRAGLKNEAKRLFVDATYSGRGHMESCSRWQLWNSRLGIPATILSSFLAGGAAISALTEGLPWITAILAGSAAVLTGLKTYLQPEKKSQSHGIKGNQYLAIRNLVRIFIEIDLHSNSSSEELIGRIKHLRNQYDELQKTDPQLISRADYKKAKKNIETGESNYTNDPLWKELC